MFCPYVTDARCHHCRFAQIGKRMPPSTIKGNGNDNIEYMTATSNSFGGPDNFFLSAYIMNGKAQFRMPAAGQWMINVFVRQEVTPENELKELVGKCTTVYYTGTISFDVKP